MKANRTIGMIAGNGIYPRTFASAARNAGVDRLVAAAFPGETESELEGQVDEIEWFRVGQLGRMIRYFRARGVTEAVMVGQIAPRNLFDLRPDIRTLVMLGRLSERNAETIFGAIAEELEKDGIRLLPATTFLDDHLPQAGHVFGPRPHAKRLRDAAFGIEIAKKVSALDIGQTVVVKKGTVLAVEAFEGTNEAIRRGGALGHGGVTVVKVSKPNQDFRFDVPVIGPETVRVAADAGADLLVIEAGCTMVLGRDEVEQICRERRISVIAAAPAPDSANTMPQ